MWKIAGAKSSNLLTYGRIMIESRVSASIINQQMLVPPHAHCKSRKIKKNRDAAGKLWSNSHGELPKKILRFQI